LIQRGNVGAFGDSVVVAGDGEEVSLSVAGGRGGEGDGHAGTGAGSL
jgi:hypothetical protein